MARHHMIDNVKIMFTAEEEAQADVDNQAWLDGATKRNAIDAIRHLESSITSRRYREAIAGTDGGWLANQENLISKERGKL